MNDTQNVVAWRMRKNDETGWILTESKPMPLNHEEAAWEVQPLYASPQASPPPQPSAQGEPVNKWEGAEEWMPLAWELCADECGEEACTELVWEGGPIPEPWGDRWLKYEDEAKRLIALVRKHVPLASAPSTPPPAVVEAVPLTDEQADALRRLWPAIEKAMGCLVFTAEQAGAVQADMNTVRHGIAPKAAQPVAGAVAEPDCWAILTPNGSKLVSPDEAKGRKDAYPLYAAPQPQAAPAPEPTSDETLTWEKPPSAIEGRLGVWLTSGAELHPRTVNLVVRFARALASKLAAAEAKYGYSDGWASPDWMDECRAKLMEHIAKGDPRDVAAYCAFLWHHGASTARPEPSAQGRPCPFGCTTQEEHDAHQSAEPSAQGEPVAWRPGDPIYDDAYVRGVAVGFAEDDSRRTTLLRIADRIEARASAPSTPPPAVVEAVPQTWPIERAADMLTAYAELVKATGRYAEEHYIPEIENVAAELRGIAPKAAQPQEKREPWLCLLCKSDRPGHHGLLDDRVTPCPDGAPKAAQQWANVPFKPETWQPDADGFTPDLCTECGTPVRYGSRHSKCAPKAAQEPRDA